jgi:hypothetical protein
MYGMLIEHKSHTSFIKFCDELPYSFRCVQGFQFYNVLKAFIGTDAASILLCDEKTFRKGEKSQEYQ